MDFEDKEANKKPWDMLQTWGIIADSPILITGLTAWSITPADSYALSLENAG
jgi:hypothetical protein